MPKAPPRLDPANPVHSFALEMRRLRLRAGDPPLAELARAMMCSHSTVSAYLNGRRLPVPRPLESFVLACKGNSGDWLERLEEVREQLSRLPVPEVRKPVAESRDSGADERPQVIADDSTGTAGPEAEKIAGVASPRSPTIQVRTPLDRNQADGPLYRGIAEDLRRAIESGELQSGAQLKTEVDLREQYQASRNTVRDAIKSLTTLGLVETRPGQGTFVTQAIDPFVTTMSGSGSTEGLDYRSEALQHRTPQHSEPRVEILTALGRLAEQLHIAARSEVISRQQQRWIDGDPWSLQTSFYPMELVRKGATRLLETKHIAGGTAAYLEHEAGIKQVRSRDEITVRAPDPSESLFFRLPGDSRIRILEVSRTEYDEQDNPILLIITIYPADRNRLAYEIWNQRSNPGQANDPE